MSKLWGQNAMKLTTDGVSDLMQRVKHAKSSWPVCPIFSKTQIAIRLSQFLTANALLI